MSIEEDAYRYAVKNAFLHGGRAEAGAIVGKVKALYPKLDIKKAMAIALEAVKKANSLEHEELKRDFERFEGQGWELKPKEKEDSLPALEWAEESREKVVTRFAPNPNAPFHLGNARTAILSKEYAERYKGRFILRFDDTDPKVKRPIEDAERIFKEDLHWLGCDPDETFFASDRLGLYYDYLRTALEKGFAYVCDCDSEAWRKKIKAKKACKCRNLEPKEQLKRFEKMMDGETKEGEAVVRIRTDLKDKDPSVRDWWAAKAVDNPEHTNPKAVGNHVWPSYNFASAIDDHLLGVTLIIRGQEHEQNKTKQEFLYRQFGWVYPHCFHIGRISLQGMVLSKSKIREGIEKGEFSGWDDPRLGTIRALRKRGFRAEALKEALLDLGVNTNDSVLQLAKVIDLNRKIIEPESERMAFFEEPLQLDVNYAPNGMHRLFVDKKAFEKFRAGDVLRLRQLFNVKIVKKDEFQAFADFVGEAMVNKPVVGWFREGVDAEVLMDDNSRKIGMTDASILEKKAGGRVCFEGFGFCIVDRIEGEKAFLRFTHR